MPLHSDESHIEELAVYSSDISVDIDRAAILLTNSDTKELVRMSAHKSTAPFKKRLSAIHSQRTKLAREVAKLHKNLYDLHEEVAALADQ